MLSIYFFIARYFRKEKKTQFTLLDSKTIRFDQKSAKTILSFTTWLVIEFFRHHIWTPSECKPVTLVPTGEPTLEPEESTFAPTGEPTLEPEDSADSGGCTRCVELVEDFRKCYKEVTMNGSPRASSSDECGPEALKQCIQQNSKAECARAEMYFSFRKVDENDESGACIYSSADQCGVTDSVTGIRTNHQWQIYTYNCCDQSEETAEPTAEPTKEPEETEEPRETASCPGWCGTHGADWSTKCANFRACKVCVRCT